MITHSAPSQSPPQGALAVFDHWYSKIENFLNGISAFAIFAVMFLGVAQVFGRKLLNMPVPGYIDFIEQSMVVFAFFGIAYCQRLGGHVRMDLFMAKFNGRTLYFFEAIATLIGLFVITVLIDKSWLHFLRAWEFGDSTIDIQLPIWPAKLIIPAAFCVLWIRFAIQVAGFTRLFIFPGAPVVAVPVIEDVEEQARHEIADALGEEVAAEAKFDETYRQNRKSGGDA
ncbi:TRAP transporter small permease subunit [Sneathiella sp. P13V-1]|uniref:TRAP transporter small permease subunit n=1 Tax=Sneathiella sp. P13V-1 TaxID=2697366 RepID=UPI00187BA346|nr:TRAP transporter small permease [Sneathiella sp. P13V-1]MBE7636486.1 TRAP transporter small permease subunit [Sneathiella sp. P13V-1]